MPKGRVVLLAALAVVAGLEALGIFTDSDTISAIVADLFHANTPTGRAIFGAVWLAFTGWFLWHIWNFRKSVKAKGREAQDADDKA